MKNFELVFLISYTSDEVTMTVKAESEEHAELFGKYLSNDDLIFDSSSEVVKEKCND